MKNLIAVIALMVGTAAFAQDSQPKEEAKEISNWKNTAYFELLGRTGIVEKTRHSGGITAERKTKENRLKLYAKYAWAEENGIKSEEEYIAGIDTEYMLTERTAWYGRIEYESDDIELLRYRVTVATGLSYYFIKEEKHTLRGRLGAFWRDEDYKAGVPNNTTVGLEAAVFHELHIDDVGVWTTEIVYNPSLEDERDYRITYTSKLALPFATIDGLSMEMGVFGQYNNYTPGPTEHYDTNYFVRLKYEW